MTGYYQKIDNDLKPGHIARSGDINLIQSSINNAISDLAVDIEGPAVIIGGDENSFKLTPSPEKYDQLNTTTDENNQWISFHEKYLRQKIRIEKSEINSITVSVQNNSTYPITIVGEIRDCETYNLLSEKNTKLTPKTSKEVTFNFDLQHIKIGDYYFIIRPISLSSIDVALNGDETAIIGTEEISDDSFQIKFDCNGTYTTSQKWTESGLKYSYNGNEYNSLYDTEISDIIYADLWFKEKFASTDNTYSIEPGTALISGQKVYLLDTHVNIDGPSQKGDRADLVALMSNGHVEVIKGHASKGILEVPVLNNALQLAYIITYEDSVDWKCSNCGNINAFTSETCQKCGKGKNKKLPAIIQDDTNGLTRKRDLREEVRRLKKYTEYNEDRNAPSRIHYNCVLDAIPEANPDELKNMVLGINDSGDISYIANDSTVEEFYWTIKDFKNNITDDLVIGNFSVKYSKGNTVDGYIAGVNSYHRCWTNKCPNCGTKGSLNIQTLGSDDNQIVCDKSLGGCGNTFCGFSGYQILPSEDTTKKLTADKEPDNPNASLVNFNEHSIGEAKSLSGVAGAMALVHTDGTLVSDDDLAKGKKAMEEPPEDAKSTSKKKPKTFSKEDNVFHGLLQIDSNSTDGIDIDTTRGTVSLKLNKYDDEIVKNEPLSNSLKISGESNKVAYTINNNPETYGQQLSEYPALNFALDKPMYVKTLTPYITEFQNMKNFSVLLFKDDAVFNPPTDKFVCYTKKFKDDSTFPNVFEGELIDITSNSTRSGESQVLNSEHSFEINQELPAGKYTLLVYGTPMDNATSGTIYVNCYSTTSSLKFGNAMTCRGPSHPDVLYIEPTNVKDYTWDLVLEHKGAKYAETGTLYSQSIPTQLPIKAVSKSINYDAGSGCSVDIYVSNNGGRTYTQIENEPIKFNGTGKLFKWKIVLKGTGETTPVVKYSDDKGFGLLFNVGEAVSDVQSTDYKRRIETRIIDAGWINANLLGDSYTYKNFSEWEFVRVWAEENDGNLDIDIFVSYSETPLIPITAKPSTTWDKVFYSTVFADLKLSDFSTNSVDYSVNNEEVEFDEHNYRMDLDTDVNYNEAQGVVISYGIDGMGDINSHKTEDERNIDGVFTYSESPKVDDNNNTISTLNRYEIATFNPTSGSILSTIISGDFSPKYSKSSTLSGYTDGIKTYSKSWLNYCPHCGKSNTLVTEDDSDGTNHIKCTNTACNYSYCGFSGYAYAPTETTEIQLIPKNRYATYYNSSYSEYNPSTIIIGKAFPSGIDMTNYNKLVLDIVPHLETTETDTAKRTKIPSGVLEVVVSLNVNGSIEDEKYVEEVDENNNPTGVVKLVKTSNVTYGKAYTINQELLTDVHNEVVISSIRDDVYAYGNVKSIGIRVKDVDSDNTLRCIANGDNNYCDSIGVANIRLESDNIYSLIPSLNKERRKWVINKDFDTTQVSYQLADNTATDEDYWGLMDFNIMGNNIIGDIATYTRDIDVSTTNWYYISFFCNKTFNKGEFIINLYGDTDGNDLIESFYLPAWDYTTLSDNAWKMLWDIDRRERLPTDKDVVDPTKESTIGTPGHSFFMGAWFKRRNYDNYNIKMIKLIRQDVDDDKNTKEDGFVGKELMIQTIRGYRSKTIPSFGPKLKLRMYPKSIENLKAPTIRKFGVVYTLS